jgi:hypothetical protein
MEKGKQLGEFSPRPRALPGDALPGRLCLPAAALAAAEPLALAFPGGAWERAGPRNKSRESQHEKNYPNIANFHQPRAVPSRSLGPRGKKRPRWVHSQDALAHKLL